MHLCAPAFAIDAIKAADGLAEEIKPQGKPEAARRYRAENVMQRLSSL